MREHQRLQPLLVLALVLTFIGPTWVTCSATCGYSDCDDWYYLSWADIEQYNWYAEVNGFLNCEDAYYCRPFQPYYYDVPSQPYNLGMPSQPYNYDISKSYQTIGNGTADYWLNDGNRFYLAGSFEQAVASYANVVKLDPYQLEAWLNMGNALYFLNRYMESLDAYNSVLGLQPRNTNALLGKSKTLLALNRTDEANAAQEMVTKLQGPRIIKLGSSGNIIMPVIIA